MYFFNAISNRMMIIVSIIIIIIISSSLFQDNVVYVLFIKAIKNTMIVHQNLFGMWPRCILRPPICLLRFKYKYRDNYRYKDKYTKKKSNEKYKY